MVKRCKECNVPLEGFGLKVAKVVFGVNPSEKYPELCNKCEAKKDTDGKCCCGGH